MKDFKKYVKMDKRTIIPEGGKETVDVVWEYVNHTITAEIEVYSIILSVDSLDDDVMSEKALYYSDYYINWVCVQEPDGDEIYVPPDVKKELEEKIYSLINIEL